jgi:hypothetical protein
MTLAVNASTLGRAVGGQRLPKTIPAQCAAANLAGDRNHLCRFDVHLTDFSLETAYLQ